MSSVSLQGYFRLEVIILMVIIMKSSVLLIFGLFEGDLMAINGLECNDV